MILKIVYPIVHLFLVALSLLLHAGPLAVSGVTLCCVRGFTAVTSVAERRLRHAGSVGDDE